MKTIFAKLRFVTRYWVAVFLAAAPCLSVFADVNCIPGNPYQKSDGTWWVTIHCTGDISSSAVVQIENDDTPGEGGSCTNCTAMSPAECVRIRDEILSTIDGFSPPYGALGTAKNALSWAKDDISFALSELETIKSQNSELNFDYVQWPIESASGNIESAEYDLSVVENQISVISSVAAGMNCSACEGSGSGGGGGGGGGGTTPSGCPCSEYINGVKNAVDNCHTKLESITERLRQWDEIIKQIKNDVYAIRQTTDRMDDFFKDDTEYNFKKLIEHTLKLSNAVVKVQFPPNLYWTEYTNATQFLDDSGSSIDWLQKGETIEEPTGGYTIDFGEYKSLNWFQRMEFLVGHLAGIFSKTNSTNADFTDDQKTKIDSAEDDVKNAIGGDNDSIGQLDGTKTILEQMVSYVVDAEGSLNPFHGIFDYSSGSTRSITFLPDVSVKNDLLGNTMPMITMDLTETGDGSFSISDLVYLAHNLTTFLWLVSFLIIDVLAIIKFVQCLIALNRWYWKIYNSWVGTMFNGAGR